MAEGEKLSGAAFEGNSVHIVTELAEGSMLYRVDLTDMQTPAEAKPEAIYSDKLRAYGDELLGLKVETDESGNRTGLRLSVYGYEGGLKEKRYTVITVDEQTDTQYLRYLSADAENSNLRIATDGSDYIAISTVYFDGISEIERILCFKDDGAALNGTTDLLLFDIQSDYRFLTFRDNMLYVVTDSRIITIDPETGKAKGYFSLEEEAAPEAVPETEAAGETEAAIE